MSHLHVRTGDTVMVVSGSAAHIRDGHGKKSAKIGKILSADPKAGSVIVEGVNIRVRHTKPRGQNQQGGRLEREMPIKASNVMLYCAKCKKPTRIAHKIENDKKVRVCKHCAADLG